MMVSSLVNLRQTCHAFDQLVMEHRSHLRILYSPPVSICFGTTITFFDQAFAGLVIQNVVCSGICNRYVTNYVIKNSLEGKLEECQRMVVSQVREAILDIIKPDILVIEDYSREDNIPNIIKNLELSYFTGTLPDFEQYTFLQKVWIKPATVADFILTIEKVLEVLCEEKLGSLDYLEITRSHSKQSSSCKSSLQKVVLLVEEALGIGSTILRKSTCRVSHASTSYDL